MLNVAKGVPEVLEPGFDKPGLLEFGPQPIWR
jgi:hypothetical protein